MPAVASGKIERLKSDWPGQKRAFNQAAREGLFLGGLHWKTEFLPLHFGPKASRRYGYPKRLASYLIRKAFVRVNRSKGRGLRKRAGPAVRTIRFRDTEPFEFRGQLKRTAIASSRVRSTATSSRMQMVVTVPTGHALRPEYSGHLTRIIKEEDQKIRSISFGHVESKIAEFNSPKTEKI